MRQTGQVLPVELRTKEKDWDLADIPLLILEELNNQFLHCWNYFLFPCMSYFFLWNGIYRRESDR